MKIKIDTGKIKFFLIDIVFLSVFAGGWILFVFSKIERQEEITREINLQTEELRKQINRCDSAFAVESKSDLLRK